MILNYENIIRAIALSFVFLFSCSAFGADVEAEDSVVTSVSKKEKTEANEQILIKTTKQIGKGTSAIAEAGYNVSKDFITGKLKNYLDSSGIKGTNPEYVGLPKRKWRVSLIGDMDKMSLYIHSDKNVDNISPDGKNESTLYNFNLDVRPPMSASTGVWVGYMGYGLGLSYLKTGKNNTNIAMNMSAPHYGINVRWIRYNTEHALHGWAEKGLTVEELYQNKNYAFDIASIVFDGYWIFNKKKFSLSAAYDLSTIQLRSAGSFIAGLMFNYQKCDYSNPDNAPLLAQAAGVGKLKMYQGSIGGGYTFNWVPTPGLVINLTGMPVLTLYSHSKLYWYNVDNIYQDNDREKRIVGFNVTPTETYSDNGKVALNITGRIAAAYRYKIYVFSYMAQAYYLRSNFNRTSFKVFQWNMKASVGITL